MYEKKIDAIVEPTAPLVAPPRGPGIDQAFTPVAMALISLSLYWAWTGFPVAALPAGLGGRTGLPVGLSLIGAPATEWRLARLGIELQSRLGTPDPGSAGPRAWLPAADIV